MATVALKSSADEGRYFEFTVTQQSGTTKVNWTFKVLGGSSPYYDTSEINCKINGKSVLTYSQTSWDKKVIPAAKGSVTGVYNVGKYGAVAIELSGNPYDHQVKSVKKSTLTLIGTYTITYNANGGSGVPSNQTKTYGVALTLSDTIPNKSGYIFVKWNTKSDGSGTSYSPNASYTANSSATLYAIWKVDIPTLSDVQVYRCNINGNKDDFGTSIYIKLNWSSETGISLVTAELDTISPPHTIQDTVIKETSGEISYKWDCDANSETSHTIVISVKGGNENSQTKNVTKKIATAKYVLDFKNGGTGLAIGKVAEEDGLDVGFTIRFRQDVRSEGDVIANLGGTDQVSLSSLANLIKTNQEAISSLVPTAQTITIPSSNANFSGSLYVATSGKVRTIYAELATKKQITASMGWLNVLTFQEKPIQTVESTFPVNSTASPVPVFLARAIPGGSLDIIARQNIASGSSLRFTLTVILA